VKAIRVFLVLVFVCGTIGSCKKDRLDGTFGIDPVDILSSKKYEKMQIEVVYVDGYQPSDQAVSNLENFLQEHINKPGGIFVNYKSISSPNKSTFTLDDLKKLEKKERDHYSHGKTIEAFVFFTDAPYTDNNVLGVAYGSTSIAVFEKTVKNNSGGFAQPSQVTLESVVIEHEFGHLMGLVNFGTNMSTSHEDGSHPNHCNNSSCLMYYGVETTDIMASVIGSNIPPLDQNCINDLKANGGK